MQPIRRKQTKNGGKERGLYIGKPSKETNGKKQGGGGGEVTMRVEARQRTVEREKQVGKVATPILDLLGGGRGNGEVLLSGGEGEEKGGQTGYPEAQDCL